MTEIKEQPIELKVIQNQVGCFNLLNPSEKSFSFSMGLYQGGKIIEENKVRARLYYSGDEDDSYDFDSPMGNLEDVFQKCFSYADKVWSSTDYRAECLLFAKIYCANYDEINETLVAKHKASVQAKIAKLQKELEYSEIVPDLSLAVNNSIKKRVALLEKWIDGDVKEQEQMKEGTDKYLDCQKKIDRRKNEVGTLNSHLITTQLSENESN